MASAIPDYRGRRPKIVWGDSGEHTIHFAYPFDEALAYPEPLPGSVARTIASGESDAWTDGQAYLLRADARWIDSTADTIRGATHTGWDDADGWEPFLRWAWSSGRSFTLWQDADDAASAFDAVLLEPGPDIEPQLEDDFTRRVSLLIRRVDGATIVGYQPHYRMLVYRPRSQSADESELLTPVASAPHTDVFAVTTVPGGETVLDEDGVTELYALQPYLDSVAGRRGALDYLECETDKGVLEATLLDKRVAADPSNPSNLERWLTAFVGDADGKHGLGGYRVEFYESLDGAATWSRYFTGRIQETRLVDAVTAKLAVADMSDGLEADVFVGGVPHTSVQSYAAPARLTPVGLPLRYGSLPVVEPHRCAVDSKDGRHVFGMDGHRLRKNTVFAAVKALADATSFTGSFSSLLPFLEFFGDQATIYARKVSDGSVVTFPLARLYLWWPDTASDEHYRVRYIYGEGMDALSVGDAYDVWVVPNGPPTADFPLLINDVHPMRLWRDLLDGYFGYLDKDPDSATYGEPLRSVPYDADAFAALIADESFGTVRFPVKERSTLVDWVGEHICKTCRVSWRFDADGVLVPIDLRNATALASVTATIDDDDVVAEEGAVGWGAAIDEAITRVSATYYTDQAVPLEAEKGQGDWPSLPPTMLEEGDVPLLIVDNTDRARDLGDRPHEFDVQGRRLAIATDGHALQSRQSLEAQIAAVAEELKAPFASGRADVHTRVLRASATGIEVGTFALLTVSRVPDPFTARRGGTRLAVCTERNEDGPATELGWLDLGGGAQLDPPTIDSYTDGGDGTATLGVSHNAANDPIVVWIAMTAQSVGVRPADGSTLWRPYALLRRDRSYGTWSGSGSHTVTVSGIPAGSRAWVRARSVPGAFSASALPSEWVYPASTGYADGEGALAAPTGLAVTAYGTDWITIGWTNADATRPVDVLVKLSADGAFSTSDFDADVLLQLPPGSTAVTIRRLPDGTPLQASTDYRVGVRARDAYGAGSSATSTTQTTAASGGGGVGGVGTTPDMGGISARTPAGSDPTRTGIVVTLVPGDTAYRMELERADDDGAGAPDEGTAETLDADIASTETTYIDALPLDGTARWYRARHVPDGDWTGWVSAVPGMLDAGAVTDTVSGPELAAEAAARIAADAALDARVDALETTSADHEDRLDALEAAPAPALDDLTDVDTATTPPTDGQALVWDETAGLWVPGAVAGGGGASLARTTAAIVTASLADAATETGTVSVAKSALLLKAVASADCWLRLYATAAARTADAGRTIDTDPEPGAGVLSDLAPGVDGASLTIPVTPAHELHNDDSPATTTLYYALTNKSGSAAAVTVTLTVLPLET